MRAAAAQSKITNCKSSESIFDGDTETKRRHKPRGREGERETRGTKMQFTKLPPSSTMFWATPLDNSTSLSPLLYSQIKSFMQLKVSLAWKLYPLEQRHFSQLELCHFPFRALTFTTWSFSHEHLFSFLLTIRLKAQSSHCLENL